MNKKIFIFIIVISALFSIFGCKVKDTKEETVPFEIKTVSDKTENNQKNDIEPDASSKSDTQTEVTVTPSDKHEESDTQTEVAVTPSDKQEENNIDNNQQNIQTPEKDNDTATDSNISEYDISTLIDSFEEMVNTSSDTFVCTILDAKTIEFGKDTQNQTLDFPAALIDEPYVTLHRVKVEKVYRSTFVSENTEIYILHHHNTERKAWAKPYETGRKYLITGLMQPYFGEPIIIDFNYTSAIISDDGTLTPTAINSKTSLEGITTLKEFENNSRVIEFCGADMYKDVFVREVIKKHFSINTDELDRDITDQTEQYIDFVKRKMAVTPDKAIFSKDKK